MFIVQLLHFNVVWGSIMVVCYVIVVYSHRIETNLRLSQQTHSLVSFLMISENSILSLDPRSLTYLRVFHFLLGDAINDC